MNSRAKIFHKEHESTDPSYLVLPVQAASGGLMVFGNIFSVHFERLSTSRVQFKHYRLPEYYSSPWPFLCSTVWFLFPACNTPSHETQSSQTGFLTMAMGSLWSHGLHSHHISIRWNSLRWSRKVESCSKGCSVRCWVYPFKSCDSYDGNCECK